MSKFLIFMRGSGRVPDKQANALLRYLKGKSSHLR
jgi:hypothetical protein